MIIYVSKGKYYMNQGEKILVNRGMRTAELSGIYSYLWSIGSRRFVTTSDKREIEALGKLEHMGLVEMMEYTGDGDKYDIMTHCILAFSDDDKHIEDEGIEKDIYAWLKSSTLNLSIAELVKLTELDIRPTEKWLGKDNLYKLVMRLYEPISSDRMLEYQMKDSEAKDKVIGAVEKLLSKGIIGMM